MAYSQMKLVILDRDGVINKDSSSFIKSPEEWLPIKGSLEAIARLSQAGYEVVIITNQSGIGRKLFNTDTLSKIHVRMIDYIQQHGGKVQSILFCPHHPDDHCNCRKPLTGMYDELAQRTNVNLKGVYSVGDSVRDLVAAKNSGAKPVLVKTGNGRKSLKEINSNAELDLVSTPVFDNLSGFTDALLAHDI